MNIRKGMSVYDIPLPLSNVNSDKLIFQHPTKHVYY